MLPRAINMAVRVRCSLQGSATSNIYIDWTLLQLSSPHWTLVWWFISVYCTDLMTKNKCGFWGHTRTPGWGSLQHCTCDKDKSGLLRLHKLRTITLQHHKRRAAGKEKIQTAVMYIIKILLQMSYTNQLGHPVTINWWHHHKVISTKCTWATCWPG